ncbi:MAG TPA: enoyl-CoA hydratase-related protein [Paraburkholderia sp.]|nr:enoyl-CoA hydratase-related protein [Paraburkholderia sp.]
MNSPTPSLAENFRYIVVAAADGVVTLTINRPGVLNAFHPPACAELGAALDAFERDPALRVALITGAGERAFSAGFDLQYANAHPELYDEPMFGSELVRRARGRKPVIAAVNGVALGFGFELALACDLIVAGRAARFGLPEVKVGLAALAGGVVRLTRELGPKRALGLALSGDIITAAEGLHLGFVNEVAEGDVMEKARALAEKLSRNAPLSLAATREMAYRSLDLPDLESALDPAQYPSLRAVLASEDAQEGRCAFLEKRAPMWKNR